MSSSTDADRAIARAALTALLWASLLMGAVVLVLGLMLVVADLLSHEDAWDGFGVFFGLLAAVPAIVVAAWAGLALRAARLRRPLAIGLGVLLVVPVMGVSDSPLLLVPMLVGVGLVVVALLGPRVAEQS